MIGGFFCCSLFQDAELMIGGTVVEGLTQAVSWTGFLKASLGLSPAAASSWGTDSLKIIPDSPGQSQSQIRANNTGFGSRYDSPDCNPIVYTLLPIPPDSC